MKSSGGGKVIKFFHMINLSGEFFLMSVFAIPNYVLNFEIFRAYL